MRRERLLKAFVFIIFTVLILSGANAGAQFGYYGPFGPYYGGPFSYGYPLFLSSAPFFPPPPAPFRGAHVLLSSLLGLTTPSPSTVPVLTTVPAATPAGFSVTTLVPSAPPSTISITVPLTALVAPVTTAPVVAPVPTTTVPGITTAILLGGGGSLTTLATLGLLPTVTTPTVTTPVVPTVPVATTTVPGITTAILLGGGGVSTTTLLALGI